MNLSYAKVLAFDFDGTLVDTMWGYARIASEVMWKSHGIPLEQGHRLYLETSGIPFHQQLELIRPGSPLNQACASEFEARKIEGMFAAPPDEPTIAGLQQLKAAGYKLVVSSNNQQALVEQYLALHPELPMDMALGFDGKGLEKGRAHFACIQDKLQVEKHEVLFCGDSLKDGEKAAENGIGFIAKTGIFSKEQFQEFFPGVTTVDTILELADHLTPTPA